MVKFTATVTPATATGTVTFKDGATTLGTGVLAGGVASFSTAGLVVGGHSITAVLTGTGVYAGSTSVAITQTVNPVSTTTTVGSSLNPATAGQVVRFTAKVTPAAATGTVTFMEGATTLGTGTRVGGIATFSTTTLAVGTHGITAVFNPTGGYTGSTSAPLTQTIKGNTVTTLATDRTPAIFGQTVTFTATVTPSAVTGAVTFKDGARILGTGTLSPAGIAIFTTAALTVGNHSITAVTAGDSIHNPSTSRVLVQTVTKVPTTTTVSSSRNPSTVGGAVAFTATVSPATATGIVTFKNGAAILGTGTLAGGTATFSNSALTVGSHSITAVLTGTGVFAGSTSPALSQTVDKVPTTTTVASSLNPSLVRQIVRFTATVTPATATGPVTFKDGATTLGTGIRIGGTATFFASGLAGGTHSISAALTGTGVYSSSASAPLTQTVTPLSTVITLASSLNPATAGQAVKFTAAVTPATATGTVTFMDGTTILGTGTRAGGIATYSTTALTPGIHTITAVLAGTASYTGATSVIVLQQVN